MHKILFVLLCLIAVRVEAQTQGDGFPAGSNLSGLACRVNENQTDLAVEEDANFCSADKKGNILVGLRSGTASATNPVGLEDSPDTPSGAGFSIHAVRNDALNTLTSADGDNSRFAVGPKGNLFTSLYYESAIGSGGPVRLEDSGIADLAPLMMIGGQRQDALALDTNASGDATTIKADALGRTITTLAPAGETWQSCGTATAVTSDVAIKAAVASNRIYTTSVTCASSDADNATNINFKDGSTVIAVGGVNQMATTSTGTFVASFPVPLRGTSNTALNFNTAVSTSSVICCAAGYISVN